MTTRILTAAIIGLALSGAATSAFAFGFGNPGSQPGDSWLNDAQKNPRFIEPYADRDPSRYRASHPREGWYDRQRADGRYGYERRPYGSGY